MDNKNHSFLYEKPFRTFTAVGHSGIRHAMYGQKYNDYYIFGWFGLELELEVWAALAVSYTYSSYTRNFEHKQPICYEMKLPNATL